MAKATVITPKPVRQPPKKIVLELSEGEADFILAVCGRVTGSMSNSPRKYASRIYSELIKVKVLGGVASTTDAYKLMSSDSRVSFEDYPRHNER